MGIAAARMETPDAEFQRQPPPRPIPSSWASRLACRLLAQAGLQVNGPAPWDPQVHDSRFFVRLLLAGDLGAGEAYMDGWWDARALDELFFRIHRGGLEQHVGRVLSTLHQWRGRLWNLQSRARAARVARVHYDLGLDLYRAMLDPTLQYTCAYWENASSLDDAQLHKLRLVAQKLQLIPGMNVLELGGGFGGLARYLAREWGCHVVSYNLSPSQVRYARDLCRGLPVRIEERDYREAARESGKFDRIVSIGLCEHIGPRNYRGFFDLCHRLLAPGGLALVHTIGGNTTVSAADPWIDKYIFPNGVIPSLRQLATAIEGLWVVEDLHNFGPDYDRTLMAWWHNFDRAWPTLQPVYGERFRRMWQYYLLCCAGAFRARKLQLFQLVLSRGDVPRYVSVR